MNNEDFISVIKSFCDSPDEITIDGNHIVFSTFDVMYDITISYDEDMNLFITEDAMPKIRARDWISKRLANLDLLARRILEKLPEELNYVASAGEYLDALYKNVSEEPIAIDDVVEKLLEVIPNKINNNSFVLYLTSDAGEGKTTTINQLARRQAESFLEKTSKKLIIPVSLNGKAFLGLDDVIVATLVNFFRFRYLDYNSFLELIKHNFLILALDGFEEMFVEKGTGDAISSLGHLLEKVKNKGNFLIAARKAYFEYQRVNTQAKLFDSLRDTSVVFSKLAVKRWDKDRFLSYCKKRQFNEGKKLYQRFHDSLGNNHPFITRPVLVKRIVDLAKTSGAKIQLESKTENPFLTLVNSIIIREVDSKWITRGADVNRQLLTLDQHHLLLGQIALEMWLSRTELVKAEVLDVVSEIFCEDNNLEPEISRQIVDRTKHHALLKSIEDTVPKYTFDHQEFYHFFLGSTIAKIVKKRKLSEIEYALSQGDLPKLAVETIANFFPESEIREVIASLAKLAKKTRMTTFTNENIGALSIKLLERTEEALSLQGTMFPSDSLEGVILKNKTFNDCFFRNAVIDKDKSNIVFYDCEFEYIDLCLTQSESIKIFNNERGKIHALKIKKLDSTIFHPDKIDYALRSSGIEIKEHDSGHNPDKYYEPDNNLQLFEKSLRFYMRLTEINEKVLKVKMGKMSGPFFKEVIPELLKRGIFEPAPYHGQGSQRRFKLGIELSKIQQQLEQSDGSFEKFLSLFPSSNS